MKIKRYEERDRLRDGKKELWRDGKNESWRKNLFIHRKTESESWGEEI